MACVWCLKHGCTNSLLCLKTWRFNICSSRQNLSMSELNFFGWPFDRKTNQQLFWALCYIFKRSRTGDRLFLLTTLQSLSFFLHHENVWNIVQGNPKFLKFLWWSMPLDLPPRSCICPPPLMKNLGYAPDSYIQFGLIWKNSSQFAEKRPRKILISVLNIYYYFKNNTVCWLKF